MDCYAAQICSPNALADARVFARSDRRLLAGMAGIVSERHTSGFATFSTGLDFFTSLARACVFGMWVGSHVLFVGLTLVCCYHPRGQSSCQAVALPTLA